MLSILAGQTEDRLHAGLDFSPGKGTSNYILDRKEVTIHPQSGGLFSNNGIRVLRFSFGDAANAFLCGETVRLAFYLRNDGATPLAPVSATPGSLFDRVRLLAGGVEVEDISYHSRWAHQEEMLLSGTQRIDNLAEGWGGSLAADAVTFTAEPIAAGTERRVMCSFGLAAFRQPKRWFMAATSLTLELELHPDSNYCFAGTGAAWTITKPVILASVLQADPAVTNGIAAFLNSGKQLTVMCPSATYNIKAAITNSNSFMLPIQRGFSKLACLQFNLFMSRPGKKECNTFDHPLAGAAPTSANDAFGFHVSLGSSRWPTMDVEGVAEQWYRTRMCMTLLDKEGGEEISITPHEFRSESGLFMLNLSKVLEDPAIGHSGVSTMNASNLVLHLKGVPPAAMTAGDNPVELPRILFVSCRYDSVVQVGQEGCRVFD